ncbi:hypothetical protein SAMN02910447_03098 [Ruminococcus sp. YE71]|uniref:hypothetical protein n=1 Tax=unclassified Ruminococcus TaxID=2608920 RepID=UPI00088520C5|nr:MULTISPECIES: hypothetical protein [unclassified Ruminococcus]SDA29819.1 hypothetical protein SAMN02910446_03169 [Ruminococcus sp. YE78]SFW48909.1 hypothetical protein SAMN02910447_03098 [Ruminococcus sp. YE71]
MKKTKTCPKCGSQDLTLFRYEGFPNAEHEKDIHYNTSMMMGVISLQRYICHNCDYSEGWIVEEDIRTVLKTKPANLEEIG